MKCIDCDCCRKGYFKSNTAAFVCTGASEPFIIEDPNVECTEYEYKRMKATPDWIISTADAWAEPVKPFIADDGIYVPSRYDSRYHEMLIPRELFVEAYNKWIKEDCKLYGQDDADDWSED